MKEFIQYKIAGICDIQTDMIIKKFTLLNRIWKIGDDWWLLGYTPKGKRNLKIQIKKEDATKIIDALYLVPFPNPFFKNSVVYVPTT